MYCMTVCVLWAACVCVGECVLGYQSSTLLFSRQILKQTRVSVNTTSTPAPPYAVHAGTLKRKRLHSTAQQKKKRKRKGCRLLGISHRNSLSHLTKNRSIYINNRQLGATLLSGHVTSCKNACQESASVGRRLKKNDKKTLEWVMGVSKCYNYSSATCRQWQLVYATSKTLKSICGRRPRPLSPPQGCHIKTWGYGGDVPSVRLVVLDVWAHRCVSWQEPSPKAWTFLDSEGNSDVTRTLFFVVVVGPSSSNLVLSCTRALTLHQP